MRFPTAIPALVVGALVLGGCGDSIAGVGRPASISAITTATQTSVAGEPVASNNNGVATVSLIGVVSAVGAGSAQISIVGTDVTKQVTVSVFQPARASHASTAGVTAP